MITLFTMKSVYLVIRSFIPKAYNFSAPKEEKETTHVQPYAGRSPTPDTIPFSSKHLIIPCFACLIGFTIKITKKNVSDTPHFHAVFTFFVCEESAFFFLPCFLFFLVAVFLTFFFFLFFPLYYQACSLLISCLGFISNCTVAILHLFFISLCVWFVLEVSILLWVTPRQGYHSVLEVKKKKVCLFAPLKKENKMKLTQKIYPIGWKAF